MKRTKVYFVIHNFKVDLETSTTHDRKIVASLCAKLRANFKVSVATTYSKHDSDLVIVHIGFFENDTNRAEQKLDKMAEAIEMQGIGRISSEENMICDALDLEK